MQQSEQHLAECGEAPFYTLGPVGIEILDASKRTADPTALQRFSFEVPSVA